MAASDYLYAAWFEDEDARPEDQDRQWVACILINAESSDDAQRWGDRLAAGYCERNPRQRFLRSSIERDLAGDTSALPSVRFGAAPPESFIGW